MGEDSKQEKELASDIKKFNEQFKKFQHEQKLVKYWEKQVRKKGIHDHGEEILLNESREKMEKEKEKTTLLYEKIKANPMYQDKYKGADANSELFRKSERVFMSRIKRYGKMPHLNKKEISDLFDLDKIKKMDINDTDSIMKQLEEIGVSFNSRGAIRAYGQLIKYLHDKKENPFPRVTKEEIIVYSVFKDYMGIFCDLLENFNLQDDFKKNIYDLLPHYADVVVEKLKEEIETSTYPDDKRNFARIIQLLQAEKEKFKKDPENILFLDLLHMLPAHKDIVATFVNNESKGKAFKAILEIERGRIDEKFVLLRIAENTVGLGYLGRKCGCECLNNFCELIKEVVDNTIKQQNREIKTEEDRIASEGRRSGRIIFGRGNFMELYRKLDKVECATQKFSKRNYNFFKKIITTIKNVLNHVIEGEQQSKIDIGLKNVQEGLKKVIDDINEEIKQDQTEKSKKGTTIPPPLIFDKQGKKCQKEPKQQKPKSEP